MAAGPADRELPHAGRDHDGGRRRADPDRSRGDAAPFGPEGRLAELAAAVSAALPETGSGETGTGESGVGGQGPGADGPDLERPVVVLTVRQAKGLEFDSVLV